MPIKCPIKKAAAYKRRYERVKADPKKLRRLREAQRNWFKRRCASPEYRTKRLAADRKRRQESPEWYEEHKAKMRARSAELRKIYRLRTEARREAALTGVDPVTLFYAWGCNLKKDPPLDDTEAMLAGEFERLALIARGRARMEKMVSC